MMTYENILHFHGHECPGIAIGYRMATAAIEALNSIRSEDEEIVAIVENDACGVDAVQCITGCTFGKGNLIFRDYGKQVYTLYSRSTRQGVRVVFHRMEIPQEIQQDREAMIRWLLSAPSNKILSITSVCISEPEPARIRQSKSCDYCSEQVMETHLVKVNNKMACIPCHEKNI